MLRNFLRVVERCLREHSPGCSTSARIGAVAFIHRFGSSLNEHLHFRCGIIDGVFEPAADTDDEERVAFHAASGLDAVAIADVQTLVRKRILRAFVRRSLIDPPNASLRAAVTALGPVAMIVPSPGPATNAAATEEPPHRAAARYLWAMLLARIYEALPLSCPICPSQTRIIAFINEVGTVNKILDHIGESTRPPRIAPARGPPLGRWQRRLNRRATTRSGIRPPSLHPRSSSISASPGRRKQDELPLVMG